MQSNVCGSGMDGSVASVTRQAATKKPSTAARSVGSHVAYLGQGYLATHYLFVEAERLATLQL
jgi:hypothetical protein